MKKVIFLSCMFLVSISFAKKWDAVYISKLIASGGIDKVIQYYQERYYGEERDPQDAFRIAELYVKKKDYATAMQWYDKESQLINTSKVNLFNYANTNRLMGEYQKALDGYLMYAAQTGDVNKVMDLANQCEKILKASSQTASYKLENYTFNTDADETNLAVLRTNPVYVVSKSMEHTNEIYQIVREYNNFLEPVKAYNSGVQKLLITSLSFVQDGNAVVFSAKEISSKKEKQKNEKIYFADNLGGNFLNVKPYPFNADAFSSKNPSFDTEGKTLYFSSNQTGGFGGFDIWESKLENGKWTKPVNTGKLLNTAADEINPFMVQDGQNHTLYFSSDREGGFGGFDIYTAKNNTGIWQDVEMQPAPVNSAGDDISIIYDNEVKTGYFSSNRMGGKGGFDVYRFIPFNLRLIVNTYDSLTEKKVDYALVQVFENGNKVYEGVTNENGIAAFKVDKDKSFTLKLSKDNYRPITAKVNSLGRISGDSVVADIYLKQDAQFAIKNNATNNLSLDNYIIFTGRVTDAATNKPAKYAKMRMVNYTTQKLRLVDLDSSGKFEIKLLMNNNYKVIFESQENKITDELTTYGMQKNDVKVRDYELNGAKFKLKENKVYKQGELPPGMNIKIDNKAKSNLPYSDVYFKNEPITQAKIDSLKKVISKDNPQITTTTLKNKPKIVVPSSANQEEATKPEVKINSQQAEVNAPLQNSTSPKEASINHKVLSNQTLYSIAKLYNVTVEDLKKWNNISTNAIKVGSVLNVITPDIKAKEDAIVLAEEKNQKVENSAPLQDTKTTEIIAETSTISTPLIEIKETPADEAKETKAPSPIVIKDDDVPLLAADMVSTKKSKKVKNISVEKEAPKTEPVIEPTPEIIKEEKIIETVEESKAEVATNETAKEVIKEEPKIEIKEALKAPIEASIIDSKPVVKTSEPDVVKSQEKPLVVTPTIIEEKKIQTVPVKEELPDLYYKVQLASYDKGNIKFPEFENIGKTEEVKAYERYIYRIGNFATLERAKEVLELVRSQGYFVAFILQYNKEKVTGIVN
ncbi:MAG TPA: LysM peptidoglycan-binding domain-containing protein [Chitinophagales bacterium]|nr:LysM peptidoglycan-binding domain-containing protein [Chitinophagales bacterium]